MMNSKIRSAVLAFCANINTTNSFPECCSKLKEKDPEAYNLLLSSNLTEIGKEFTFGEIVKLFTEESDEKQS